MKDGRDRVAPMAHRLSEEPGEEGVIDLLVLHAAAHEKILHVETFRIDNRKSDHAVVSELVRPSAMSRAPTSAGSSSFRNGLISSTMQARLRRGRTSKTLFRAPRPARRDWSSHARTSSETTA